MTRPQNIMMSKTIAAILQILLISINCGAQETVTSKYDKFKGTTDVHTTGYSAAGPVSYDGGKPSASVSKVKLFAGFNCTGESDTCYPDVVGIVFIGWTKDWVLRENKEIRFLIDDKPVKGGIADWDGDVLEAGVQVEYLTLNANPELLRALANASAVDVQVGIFEFNFTQENLQELRALARHIAARPRKK